jgi:hypothetical protein
MRLQPRALARIAITLAAAVTTQLQLRQPHTTLPTWLFPSALLIRRRATAVVVFGRAARGGVSSARHHVYIAFVWRRRLLGHKAGHNRKRIDFEQAKEGADVHNQC